MQLAIDQKDIDQYLSEVKEAVEKDNYRLDRNARRQDNTNLFLDYVIESPFCGGFFSFNHIRCRTSCLQRISNLPTSLLTRYSILLFLCYNV